jgi:hypothetical protein
MTEKDFRRLFLEGLAAAFKAGELKFFTDLARLKEPDAFNAYLVRFCVTEDGFDVVSAAVGGARYSEDTRHQSVVNMSGIRTIFNIFLQHALFTKNARDLQRQRRSVKPCIGKRRHRE